jgi:WD40 repeat protein
LKVEPSLVKESQAHFKSINDILFIEDKNMLVTAGADGLCNIFEISTLKLLKKLCFKVKEEEKNYSMRGLRYDNCTSSLFTIQAPLRGSTYLTKWDLRNNFCPISTVLVSDSICTSIDYSPFYDLIGLADCKGSLIYVNPSGEMSKIKEVDVSEITIKSVAFKDSNLISGAADNALSLNYIYKPNLISLTSTLKMFLFIFFVYYVYLKMNK